VTPSVPADTVRAFYQAVRTGDASAVADLVEQRFHVESSITWPESLPYGGTVSGRSRLQKVLAGAATAAVGPSEVELVSLAAGEVHVAVELRFNWRPTPDAGAVETGAVEWWTFDQEGLVRSVRAYYADTAALGAPIPERGP
jgi:ketosteroid isomerase-like protein